MYSKHQSKDFRSNQGCMSSRSQLPGLGNMGQGLGFRVGQGLGLGLGLGCRVRV